MTTPSEGTPRWLSADQLTDWTSLMAALMTLPGALDTQLKRDAGLNTFEYHILVQLAERPDGVAAMGDLAHLTQGSPSRLSHAVSRLERDGWIERRSAEGRCVNAHLTAAGREKLERSAPGHVAEVRRLVVDAVDAEDLRALGRACRAIAERADPALTRALRRQREARDGGC